MSDIKKHSALESLLFVCGEPMEFKKISKLLSENEEEVKNMSLELAKEYGQRESGIRVMINNDSVQMVTAKENAGIVDSFLKMDIEGELSRSALETISIIAYRGPMTRSQIEEIRGVNCSFTLRQLAIRGLVEKIDNPSDSRSYLYQVSLDFLRHMGLEKIEDLPRYQDLRERELVAESIARNSEAEKELEGEMDTEKDNQK